MKLINARTLADRLGVSVNTVNAWTRCGCIPCCLRVNRKVIRYDLDAVLKALRDKSRACRSAATVSRRGTAR